jgi:hypothetical protein
MRYTMINDEVYPLTNDEEFLEAQWALNEAGLSSAKIYSGDPSPEGNSVVTFSILFPVENYKVNFYRGEGDNRSFATEEEAEAYLFKKTFLDRDCKKTLVDSGLDTITIYGDPDDTHSPAITEYVKGSQYFKPN